MQEFAPLAYWSVFIQTWYIHASFCRNIAECCIKKTNKQILCHFGVKCSLFANSAFKGYANDLFSFTVRFCSWWETKYIHGTRTELLSCTEVQYIYVCWCNNFLLELIPIIAASATGAISSILLQFSISIVPFSIALTQLQCLVMLGSQNCLWKRVHYISWLMFSYVCNMSLIFIQNFIPYCSH